MKLSQYNTGEHQALAELGHNLEHTQHGSASSACVLHSYHGKQGATVVVSQLLTIIPLPYVFSLIGLKQFIGIIWSRRQVRNRDSPEQIGRVGSYDCVNTVYDIPLSSGCSHTGQMVRCLRGDLREHAYYIRSSTRGAFVSTSSCACAPLFDYCSILMRYSEWREGEIYEAFSIDKKRNRCLHGKLT